MNIALVQFPGSNCERETRLAVERAGMRAIDFLWNEDPAALDGVDGLILVGGFSYQDRSRAGIIAAQSALMQAIKKQAEAGKPVLGICNGAQILVEAGLVPGLENYQPAIALTENKRVINGQVFGVGFYNSWVKVKALRQDSPCLFTRDWPAQTVCTIPAAHAQGRFVMDDETLRLIKSQGLDCLQYVNGDGEVEADFPVNPNGSVDNLAAVCNLAGNVMAIMPHPERVGAGDLIFQAMHRYLQAGQPVKPAFLPAGPAPARLKGIWDSAAFDQSLLVELVITDNEALSVEKALQQQGWPVHVARFDYYGARLAEAADLMTLGRDILYNPRKEIARPPVDWLQSSQTAVRLAQADSLAILVMPHDNIRGQSQQQALDDRLGHQVVNQLSHGVLWLISPTKESDLADGWQAQLLDTGLFANPLAQDCYEYPC